MGDGGAGVRGCAAGRGGRVWFALGLWACVLVPHGAAAQGAPPPAGQPAAAGPSRLVPVVMRTAGSPLRRVRGLTWGVWAGAYASLVTATALGLAAGDRQADFSSSSFGSRAGIDRALALREEGRRLAVAAGVMLAVCGVAVVAAVWLTLRDLRHRGRESALAWRGR